MDNSNHRSGGVGFLSLLTLLFIGLKLTNNIDWSWLWVLAPTWVPVSAFIGLLTLNGILGWLMRKLETDEQRKKRELAEAFDGMKKAITRNRN